MQAQLSTDIFLVACVINTHNLIIKIQEYNKLLNIIKIMKRKEIIIPAMKISKRKSKLGLKIFDIKS